MEPVLGDKSPFQMIGIQHLVCVCWTFRPPINFVINHAIWARSNLQYFITHRLLFLVTKRILKNGKCFEHENKKKDEKMLPGVAINMHYPTTEFKLFGGVKSSDTFWNSIISSCLLSLCDDDMKWHLYYNLPSAANQLVKKSCNLEQHLF